MIYEIKKNVDVKWPWNQDNYLLNHFLYRRKLQTNSNEPILEDSLKIFTLSDIVILKRTAGLETIKPYVKDNVLILDTPLLKDEEELGKDNDLFIFAPGLIIMTFQLKGTVIDEKIKKLPQIVMFKLFKERNKNKIVEFARNDILINDKKVCGFDIIGNNTGTYQGIALNYYYDDELFKKLLNEHQLNRKTGSGITGVYNEYPDYEQDEFINDFIKEIKMVIEG
jgi:hypothetical protein